MNWTKTSDSLPPAEVVVDTISIGWTQKKLMFNGIKDQVLGTIWSNGTEDQFGVIAWKLPDPVADASQELLACLSYIIAQFDHYTHGLRPEMVKLFNLTDARALLKRLEP